MSEQFEKAINFVLSWEGGFSDHPSDAGGQTKFGISQRAYPQLNISNLTLAEAKDIYERDYWRPLKGDQLPPVLSFIVLDYAVHSGVYRAARALQQAVNVGVDGFVGPLTVGAARIADHEKAAKEIIRDRFHRFLKIVEKNPIQKDFLKGWLNRTHDLAFEAGKQ